MAGQIIFYSLAAALAFTGTAFTVAAWRIGRIGDRRDFSILGAFGVLVCACLYRLFVGAIA